MKNGIVRGRKYRGVTLCAIEVGRIGSERWEVSLLNMQQACHRRVGAEGLLRITGYIDVYSILVVSWLSSFVAPFAAAMRDG